MVKKRITIIFLFALTAFALYLCYILFEPFLYPLLSAVVIAVVFHPVHARMLLLIRNQSTAALLSTVLVVAIIIVPAIIIGAALFKEITNLGSYLDARSTESGGPIPYLMHLIERPLAWAGQYVDVSQINVWAWLKGRLDQIGAALAAQGGIILGNITSFIINAVITLFTLFFFFREGKTMRRRLAAVLPLTNHQIEQLFTGIENTIIATVYGGIVVAAVQGGLVGLALWVFGIHSPLLWGLVASAFALLPLVGTAVVWVPAALYLILSGHWVQGLILIGWGAGIVGTVDNFLRPYLISGRVRMHTLLIFFSVFGGVQAFGFLGLFVGPVILAVTITLLGILRDESKAWRDTWEEPVKDEG
jgi:predicted PurR-regulated permease PerM